MKIVFLGADHEVTGSCHYLEVGDKKFLVDCGMEQGADLYENQEIPVNPGLIDYVFITHAHIDHSGLLPLLYKNGFKGQVFATQATCMLCDIMLRDSAHIQESEAEWKNRKAARAGGAPVEPMYSLKDAMGVLEHFVPCVYRDRIVISPEISVRFVDAGHLLGSASIEMWLTEGDEERKVVFSGDLGNGNRPIIRDPEFVNDADYVLIESTYGDRLHETPPDFAIELAKVIQKTMDDHGNVVIPAFSVGRTQEVLYYIRRIKEEGLVVGHDGFEVYMDSPLAVEATTIFSENVSSCFKPNAQEMVKNGHNPIYFKGLKMAITSDESKLINLDETPKVIISASGMCEAGRVRHHLKHNLWRKECAVVFVGFQVPGTLGHSLINGANEIKLFGEAVNVKAHIYNLHGMSGHADKNMLLEWIRNIQTTPKKVFVVHGDDKVVDQFASTIKDTFGYDAAAPYTGEEYDLLTGVRIKEGNTIKLEPKTGIKARLENTFFGRLVAAGERLMRVIQKCSGLANRDAEKFAAEIDALSDKWDM